MIFVDTSAWFALFVASDGNHSRAEEWLRESPKSRLTTSNLVVAELLTLLRARGRRLEEQKVSSFLRSSSIDVAWVGEGDFQASWTVFDEFADKGWSFVDCSSKVIMERLDLRCAFAFDQHFAQFGSVTVVP